MRRSQRFCVYGVYVERSLEEGHYMLPTMTYWREMVSGCFRVSRGVNKTFNRGGTLSLRNGERIVENCIEG